MACSRVKLWVCLFFAVIALALLLPAGIVSAADPVVRIPTYTQNTISTYISNFLSAWGPLMLFFFAVVTAMTVVTIIITIRRLFKRKGQTRTQVVSDKFSDDRRLKRANPTIVSDENIISDTAKTKKHYTSIKLFVRIGQNFMSRSESKDKPVEIFLDGENTGEFGWVENRDLVISDGKHELTVVPKPGEKYLKNVQPVPQTMSFEAGDEDIIRISCHYLEPQGWYLIKEDWNETSTYWLKMTFGTIYFIGAYNLVVGLLFTLLLGFDFLRPLLGLPLLSIIVGVIYLILGFLVQRKSYIALIIAIGLVVLDLIFAVITLIPGDIGVILWFAVTIIIHILLLSFMVPGLSAIKALRQKEHISTN